MIVRSFATGCAMACLVAAFASTSPRAAPPAPAAPAVAPVVTVSKGEEVDVTSAAVTALSCALKARDEGKLDAVNSCPYEEATKGIVIFDVAEKQIYLLDKKKVRASALEKAFGGGSVDFSGVVKKVDKSGVAAVEVQEMSVTPKPKAGHAKACL